MKREDLIAMGISEENADKIMADYGNAIQKANAKADQYKTDAQKSVELQAELDRINEEKLSDIEKANKATETANNRVEELEKEVKSMQTKAKLAEKGIVGEKAENLILEDGSINFDILGQIISEREAAAATAKEQEIANNATNPGGGSGRNNSDTKSTAEKIAEKMFSGRNQNNEILSHYVGGKTNV